MDFIRIAVSSSNAILRLIKRIVHHIEPVITKKIGIEQ